MANTRDGNVIRIDTTDSVFSDVRQIKGIKYVGASSGTATIKNAEGTKTLWVHSGNVIVFEDVCIINPTGFEVEVTNSAVVYLYLA